MVRLILAAALLVFPWVGLTQQQQPQAHTHQTQAADVAAQKDKAPQPHAFQAQPCGDTQIFNNQTDCKQGQAEGNSVVKFAGMRLTSAWVLNVLTGTIVVLTFLYVCVAIWQVITVHDTERAWVIITPKRWSPVLAYIDPAVFGPTPLNVFEVSVKNVGKTPAKIIEISWKYKTIERLEDLPKEPEYDKADKFNDFLLVPRDSIGKVAPLEPRPSLSLDEARAIENCRTFVYAYGFVSYKDVYGHKRITRRCFVYNFPQGLLASVFTNRFQYGGPKKYNEAT